MSDEISLATKYYPSKKKSDRLIIVSNAFCADQNSYPIYDRFAQEATKFGFNTITYDYSCRGQSPGKQEEATVKTHIKDLAEIINHYRKLGLPNDGTKPKIALVGHSLGGLVSTNNYDKDIKAIVLWNSPMNLKRLHENYRTDVESKGYTIRKRGDKEIIVGKEMWKQFDYITHNPDSFKDGKVIAIVGENDQILKGISTNEYTQWLNNMGKTDFIKIPGTNDHNFETKESEKYVIESTLKYLLDKFSE